MDRIARLRERIDDVDRSIVRSLALRRKLVERIGEEKRSARLGPLDPAREDALRRAWARYAAEDDLPAEVALAVLDAILDASRRHVTDVVGR